MEKERKVSTNVCLLCHKYSPVYKKGCLETCDEEVYVICITLWEDGMLYSLTNIIYYSVLWLDPMGRKLLLYVYSYMSLCLLSSLTFYFSILCMYVF